VEADEMNLSFGAVAASVFLVGMSACNVTFAQKAGGILRTYSPDSPPSLSIHEEVTVYAEGPMMGVFNNLVEFDQHVNQNSLNSVVPDLATGWSWNEDGTELTLPLRHGVKWHDGQPYTAQDVRCTWDLLTGKSNDKLRVNPRKSWYANFDRITTNGDYEVTFHLKRAQPAFLTFLASGYSPVYPCHVSARDMRSHPIGTGPFKFVSFSPNESIKVARNPDYWKLGLPHLDGIEYTIIRNPSTAILGFAAGKFDVTFPYALTPALLKDVNRQMPDAACDMSPRRREPYLDHQPPRAAIRQARAPAGDDTDHRPQGLCRHHNRRTGRYRWSNATPSRGHLGDAAGDPAHLAGLRSRCGKKPDGSSPDYGAARLRSR
jgi:peptide/nickel transport system substrate-binding protein